MREEARAHRVPITSMATRNSCPVCLSLREYQNELLKGLKPAEYRRFCNTHGWIVANTAPAESAASIFLTAILNPEWRVAPPVPEECDFCKKIWEEKERRLAEMAKGMQEPKLRSWLHDYGTLCARHGRDIMKQLPSGLQTTVQELITRNSGEIVEILEAFLERLRRGSHAGGGVLGRAAEFLLAQRGIES